MSVSFALPDVGEGLHEAEIVQWLVAVGDTVDRDQPLVEVLTDKAQVELPSPAAGVVRRLAVAVGDVVPVGTVLVEIDGPSEGRSGPARSAAVASEGVPAAVGAGAGVAAGMPTAGLGAEPLPVASAASPAAPGPAGSPAAAPSATGSSAAPSIDGSANNGPRPKASPSTRKLAASLGVDLRVVPGTGPGGRVLATDVQAAAEAAVARPEASVSPLATAAPPPSASAVPPPAAIGPTSRLGQMPAGTHPLRGIRRLTAQAMTQSWSTIPHITGMDEVDASGLLEARRRLRDLGGERAAALTPLALLAMAAARALRRFPLVNAGVTPDGASVAVHAEVNLGVAVATDDGLVVPVVTAADRRGPLSMAAEIARLTAAARQRSITAAELRGGTFTLTNYGALGGRLATPLILPGQAGIMGFGAIKERPIVVEGAVVARPTLPVVFSADHRIIDGDLSVAFQEFVLGLVRDPLALLLEP